MVKMMDENGKVLAEQALHLDTCVVCNNDFDNPGQSPDMVFLCSPPCSRQFKDPERKKVIKQLYREQFLKRGKDKKGY